MPYAPLGIKGLRDNEGRKRTTRVGEGGNTSLALTTPSVLSCSMKHSLFGMGVEKDDL